MDILYVFGSFGGGGTEHHFYSLLKHRNQPNWNPSLFIISNDDDYIKQFSDLNIPIYYITKPTGRSLPGLHLLKSIFYLFNTIRKNNFDIVHTYFFQGHVYGTLAARILGVKTVYANREDSGFFLKPIHFKILNKMNRRVNKIIPIAHFAAEARQNLEKFSDEKYQVIHNGITLNCDAKNKSDELRTELSLDKDDYLAAVVANMNYEIKGHKYLLEAARKLKDNNIDIKILLIGDGQLKTTLIEQAKSLDIEDMVLFLGYRDDVHDILESIDLFILPSLSEGLSIAILEAMRARLPILATQVGGNPEIITNKHNGLLVPSKDSDSLSDAIQLLYKDSEFSNEIAENTYKTLTEKFTLDKVTQSYWDLYNSNNKQERL
jgi:L-malate glycosyltransferase